MYNMLSSEYVVMSLFGEVPGINVRSITAELTYPITCSSQLQYAHSVILWKETSRNTKSLSSTKQGSFYLLLSGGIFGDS